MSIIEQMVSDFAAIERREVTCASLDLTFYVSPMTVKQKVGLFQSGDGNIGAEMMVDAIILCAKDADGKQIFHAKDRQDLLGNVSADVVLELFSLILPGDEVEAEKKD